MSFYLKSKRLIDVVVAVCGLVLLSPILVAVALAVRFSSHGPVLFRQERLGQFGRTFIMYKFRTMRHRAGPMQHGSQVTAAGDKRITPVGRFLRRYKLDELPQLMNVLKGDMSLVGPRPEVDRYARCYPAEYARILAVRPGITDIATIAFRDEERILARSAEPEQAYISEVLPAKIRLYFKYLEEQSLKTDLSILVRTIWTLPQ